MLTAVSLLTVILILCVSELAAWQVFPIPKSTMSNCLAKSGPSGILRGVPNSVCTEESFETGRVEYRFNDCGFRSGSGCGSKPPGTYRIVMTGSSFGFGMHVDRDKSFAALLPAELSQLTGRKVELINESMILRFPRGVSLSVDEMLASKPDMILWALSSRDMLTPSQADFDAVSGASAGIVARVIDHIKTSRTRVLLQYYLYKNTNPSVKLRLMSIGRPDYLSANLSPSMKDRLTEFDLYYADIETRARAAGVLLVVAMVPGRTQAALVSMNR